MTKRPTLFQKILSQWMIIFIIFPVVAFVAFGSIYGLVTKKLDVTSVQSLGMSLTTFILGMLGAIRMYQDIQQKTSK